jgi:heavy metal sensor kinase
MSWSIRTHLTILIVVVFLCIFLFLFLAGGTALYLSLNHATDKNLATEEKRLAEMVNSEFYALVVAKTDTQKTLSEEFVEELNEIYLYKHQFVMISIESNSGRHVYTGGERENVQRLLAGGFLSHADGFYDSDFDGSLYRILIRQQKWGRLIIGAENQTFFEMAGEFKNILLIGFPVLIILVIFAGNFLARRAMRPVVSAAENADRITLASLENHLSDYNKKDEFGILVHTLNRMTDRIDQGVQQIRRFTQDAAHELRTPITILRGELELLYQNERLSDEDRESLQKALDKTIVLQKIVDDLMLLARSDSGDYAPDLKVLHLDRLMNEVVEDIKILAENRPIEVLMDPCEPVEYTGDESLIRRLLLNLSDNALKFTKKGKIVFSLRNTPSGSEIRISDTGAGIPEQDLPHIFDRFYRGEPAGMEKRTGSGLGLAISKWIVDAHGGSIEIESTPSRGTTVTIRLPAADR